MASVTFINSPVGWKNFTPTAKVIHKYITTVGMKFVNFVIFSKHVFFFFFLACKYVQCNK